VNLKHAMLFTNKSSYMNKNEHVNLTRENINQVIVSLTEIDTKIADLHHISAKDFLSFNELLKEYHQKARQVTKVSNDLFDFFCNLDRFPMVENAQSLHQLSNLRINNIRQVALQVSDSIKKTQEDVTQLFVPFNNFRQNLMTLKFLFTNVKLTQWISDPVRAEEISELTDRITSHIQNTKDELPVLDHDIQYLSKQMGVLFEHIQTLLNEVFPEIENQAAALGKNLGAIHELKNRAVEDSRKIEQLSQRCFKNLDNVITNLQYHDIIRQKMEHIQITHKTIIDDLSSVEDNGQYEKNSQTYIKQIPEVAEIQAAQLMFTNKEYQNAIETITQKLLETGNDLNSISEICNTKITNISRIEGLVGQLWENSVQLHKLFHRMSDLAVKLTSCCAYYQDKIEEQVNKKQELQEIEEKLTILSEKIKHMKRAERVQIDIFSKQIDPLLSDIHNSRIRMENLIPDAKHSTLRAQLLTLTENIAVATIGVKQPSESLKSEMNDKLTLIKEIVTHTENIDATGLMRSIERVAYYDVFDREVEKIIDALNKIYIMLVPFNDATKTPKDLLTNMEALYTMQTQRDLHTTKKPEDESAENESDIELF
jgi:hypothetical protein